MHDPLVELAPAPAVPLHPGVAAARTAVVAALRDVLAIPDDALERPWRWRPTDEDDADVRYGIYRLHEGLEEAISAVERGRAAWERPSAATRPGRPAIPPLAAATAARWDLSGVLIPLTAAELDAAPGNGEWTVRRTLGHVVTSQRSYGWTSAWFLHRAGEADAGEYPPDGAIPPDGDEDEDGLGSVDEVRERLDSLVDAVIEHFAALDPDQLAVPGRWSGLPVTIDFRLGRLGSHIREHTIQVDKTLAMIGHTPTETARLVRLIADSYGRLEGLVIGRDRDELDRPLGGGPSVAAILESAARGAAATAASARSAAAPG
jgi:hypothetical protein